MTDKAEDASLPVFVVDQNHRNGKFDEHKVIMGAATEAEARATYLQNYEKGWTGLDAITEMSLEDFKAWVMDASKTKKPAATKTAETATPDKAVYEGTPSSSQAVNDFIEGKRPDAPTVAEVKAEQKTAAQAQFANNKLFTADKVAAARARMKSKLGQLNSGIDPELLVDGMTIAGAYI